MEAIEIVKYWNSKKGSRYPVVNGADKSSIVKRIENLGKSLGEENIERYFLTKANEETCGYDIWSVADNYLIKKWLEDEKKPELIVEDFVPTSSATTATANADTSILSLLSNEIVKLMGTELANNIGKEVENKINKYVEDKVVTKIVEYKGEERRVEGIAHECLETVLKFVAMDEPVMMVGPAGTGKNVIAKQVAEALGLEFYFSNAVTQEYKITGYGDANGKFVETQFYKAFTNGGLFLLDEMDASCPEALIVLNCAIANKYFDFPVIGRVKAHENFRVIACANTYGTGASMEYVGRNQLDGATLNRFALVEINYDNRIEDNVCPDKELADYCRDFRKVCLKNGVHHIVSYREMSRLYKMINVAKLDKGIALKTCLFKGLEKDTLKMICNDLSDNEYKILTQNIIK